MSVDVSYSPRTGEVIGEPPAFPGCFYIVSRGCGGGMCCGEGSVELSGDVPLE